MAEQTIRDRVSEEVKQGFSKSFTHVSQQTSQIMNDSIKEVTDDVKAISSASLNFLKGGFTGITGMAKGLFGKKEEEPVDETNSILKDQTKVIKEQNKPKKTPGIFVKQHDELVKISSFLNPMIENEKKMVEEISLVTNLQKENLEQQKDKMNADEKYRKQQIKKELREKPKKGMFGKLWEKLGGMVDIFLIGLGGALGALFGALVLPFATFSSYITTKFKILKFMFGGIFNTIVKGLKLFKKFPIFDKLFDIGRNIKTFFAPVIEKMSSFFKFFKNIGSKSDELIKGVSKMDKFMGAFGKVFTKVLKFAGPLGIILNIIDGVRGFIDGFVNKEGNIFEKVVAGVMGGLTKIFELPINIIGWLVDKVKSFFGMDTSEKSADKITGFIQELPFMIIEKIKSIVNSIKEFFTTGVVGETVEKIKIFIGGLFGSFTDNISLLKDRVITFFTDGNIIDNVFGLISNTIKKIFNFPISLLEKLEIKVRDFFGLDTENTFMGQFKEIFNNFVDDTINWFKDLYKKALNFIFDFMPGGNWLKDKLGLDVPDKKETPKETVNRLEDKGVIDKNIFGKSEIKDWDEINKLRSDELQKLIDYNDWTKEDLEKLKNQKNKNDKIIPKNVERIDEKNDIIVNNRKNELKNKELEKLKIEEERSKNLQKSIDESTKQNAYSTQAITNVVNTPKETIIFNNEMPDEIPEQGVFFANHN